MWFERIVMICHPHVALAKPTVQWSDTISEVALSYLCIHVFTYQLFSQIILYLEVELSLNVYEEN